MKKAISRMIRQFPLRVALPALVVIMGAAGAFAMIETAPKAQKRPPEATAPLVDTRAFAKETHRVRIPVMGTVVAARQVTLEARVSGEVIAVDDDFLPGGHFRKGEEMLRIDPTDYELTLDEVRAEVADAQYSLKVEKGHQTVAGREWELLKDTATGSAQEAELALRKPHLEKARADLEAAKAKLDQARLDLSRTVVTAPFSCMVVDTATDLGATVSNQEALATLVGTEACWVRVSVPVDRLGWIAFPADGSPGSKAVVDAGGDTGQQYEGGVIRLLPALEDEGRMARVLVQVDDPFNLSGTEGRKPLLLGSYASVTIDGGELSGVFAIPRKAFRDNGQLWVLTNEDTLDIRTVTPVWRDSDFVYIRDGLASGERVVTGSLASPVNGMKLRTEAGVVRSAVREVVNHG